MTRSRVTRKTNRRKLMLKRMLTLFIISFIVFGGVTAYFLYKVADVTTNANEELERGKKSEMREVAVKPGKDNISILFLGVDDRGENLEGRTDSMILATFNKEQGSVLLTSIPRDSLVTIPGRKYQDKINHAHGYGGVDLAVETVEQLFDIPVDYYVKLNFIAFIEIIDALGGIEVNVPFSFKEMDSNDRPGAITLNEGLQTLNGEEALAFARMRKQDPRGDIGRGERQQEVIKGIIKKGTSITSITSYGDVLESIKKHLTMNLSFGNIVSLHSYGKSIQNVESLPLEGEDRRIKGVYYYVPTEESVLTLSHRFKAHLEITE